MKIIPRLEYVELFTDSSFSCFVFVLQRVCARAEFQFDPNARLTLDEAGSNASGEEFDLNAWRGAFGQSKLAQAMYFV